MSNLTKQIRTSLKLLEAFPADSRFASRVLALADRLDDLETVLMLISAYGDPWSKKLAGDALDD